MSYLDRPVPPKGPPWAHNSLGASVHNALAAWWRLPLARRTVEAAGALLDQGWITEGYASDAQSARYRDWARGMVEAYVAGLDPAEEPAGIERTVATRTDVIAVSGRIDRLDERPLPDGRTELVVVDYKTGRHVLSVDDARSSLAPRPMSGCARRCRRRSSTRCSRPGQGRPAAGATTCGTAQKAGPRPFPGGRGTVWPTCDLRRWVAHGACGYSAAFSRRLKAAPDNAA